MTEDLNRGPSKPHVALKKGGGQMDAFPLLYYIYGVWVTSNNMNVSVIFYSFQLSREPTRVLEAYMGFLFLANLGVKLPQYSCLPVSLLITFPYYYLESNGKPGNP